MVLGSEKGRSGERQSCGSIIELSGKREICKLSRVIWTLNGHDPQVKSKDLIGLFSTIGKVSSCRGEWESLGNCGREIDRIVRIGNTVLLAARSGGEATK